MQSARDRSREGMHDPFPHGTRSALGWSNWWKWLFELNPISLSGSSDIKSWRDRRNKRYDLGDEKAS